MLHGVSLRGHWWLSPSIVGLLCALSTRWLPAQAPSFAAERYHNVVVEHDVEIPMRDGVLLRATLYRPDAPGRFPAILYRTPYGKDSHLRRNEFPGKAVRRGYLVFVVDVRGRYRSDGVFRAYLQERADGYDTIEWVARHPRSDGRVGTYGGSYPGYVQWLALAEGPPHLATAVPDMTPTSSHHFFYMGGAFSHTWYEWFMPLILPDLRRRANDRAGPWEVDSAYAQWVPVRRRWYAFRPLIDVPLLREHAPYFYDWLTHPDSSAWWGFANVESEFHRMSAPILTVSGWFDNTYGTVGAVRGFNGIRRHGGSEAAREHSKLVLGPWKHTSITVHTVKTGSKNFGQSAGLDFDDLLLRWFDQRLKGIDTGIDDEPPVWIFVMGDNEWRFERSWPPANAETRALYFHSGGAAQTAAGNGHLSWTLPADEPADEYTFDPRLPVWDSHFEDAGPFDQAAVEAREDVLVFTSDPLESDLEVTGEIEAILYVSSDALDTDFAVMVTDVHPDGASYNVLGPEAGYLRMRYREGYDRQRLMEPGEVYQIRVGHMLTSNVFKRGHRIRVHITSSRAPHFDPNPNTGTPIATEQRLIKARQRVYHDARRPSHLLLPVAPRR